MPKRPPFSRRGEQAIQGFQKAALADAMPGPDVGDDVYPTEARLERARAEHYLKPVSPVSVSAGEAITQENIADSPDTHARIIDTLAHPNAISVGASIDRTNAAFAAGVLEPAVDAAASAQASNSIEKMLCHQMAGAHFTAMRLLECAANEKLDATDMARLTNAAARMMEVYHAALSEALISTQAVPSCLNPRLHFHGSPTAMAFWEF
jgi:hypothetical protein